MIRLSAIRNIDSKLFSLSHCQSIGDQNLMRRDRTNIAIAHGFSLSSRVNALPLLVGRFSKCFLRARTRKRVPFGPTINARNTRNQRLPV